ncbi:MAG: hypothetical protein IKV92_02690 [Akkermansia sp.]|nr:hypothetical protein [Akkermansia sp.]
MKRSFFSLALLGLTLSSAQAEITSVASEDGLQIADKVGRAGMAAVLLPESNGILMTGGANFPNAKPGAKTPAERGAKAFYGDVSFMDLSKGCTTPQAATVGNLPAPIGYAAYAAYDNSMIIAGGCNASGHLNTVTCTQLKGDEASTSMLPELPTTIAYPAFAVVGTKLYVMGGQEKADSVTCLSRSFVLDMADPNKGWQELARMPEARMLAAAGVIDGKIYVTGGCSLHPDAAGAAERTYLHSTLCYDPATDSWSSTTPMPEPLVGAANPLPAINGKLYVVAGDPGNFYRASLTGKAPAIHPGQNKTVYSFTPATGQWVKEGENATGVATCPAVQWDDCIYIISGETHPGVRTPLISNINLSK